MIFSSKFQEELDEILKKKIDGVIDIFRLYVIEYVIFLSQSYFINTCLYNSKKRLLRYFDKYEILYLNFYDKNRIIEDIRYINEFIKKNDENMKKLLNIMGIIFNNEIKKIKPIYFSENNIEPNVLYKNIKFSNQQIYICLDNYIFKKMEYKLRNFCQIAEKLGAQKITIDYLSNNNTYNSINGEINIASLLGIGTNYQQLNNINNNIQIIFEYGNGNNIDNDININKFYIIDSIIRENDFLITRQDFESDLELQFLLDARCINFIKKYNTNFIINNINKIEKKILVKAEKYGLTLANINNKESCIKININIDFYEINKIINLIDGTNIHILREGFIFLSNIIKKDNDYKKILLYLQSHINAIEKKWIKLDYEYENIHLVNKIYCEIINLYTNNEIIDYIEIFFKNNISWHRFIKFRDILLKGEDDKHDKFYFTTFQYHDILNNINYIMSEISKFINVYIDKLFSKESINENDNENDDKYNNIITIERLYQNFDKNNIFFIIEQKDNDLNMLKYKSNTNKLIQYNNNNIYKIDGRHNNIRIFLLENKEIIKRIIYNCYFKSLKMETGITNYIYNEDNINDILLVLNNILSYYYDNDIKKLQKKLNDNINNIDFNIKEQVFIKSMYNISIFIFKNRLNLCSKISEKNIFTNDMITLYTRQQEFFIKYVIKHNNYIDSDEIKLLKFVLTHIDNNKIYVNYNKYKLFYLWDDYIFIKNNFVITHKKYFLFY
jgi:hypothetical protein